MAKKIAIGFGILVLIALLLLIATPVLFKSQLNNWIKGEINANVNGVVNYASADITWFKHFPDVDLTLNKLTITGDSAFKDDTVVYIEHLEMTVAWSGLWQNSGYRVLRVNAIRPQLNLKIDSLGRENWHLLKIIEITPGEGVVNASDNKQLSLDLDNCGISDARFNYSDLKHKNQLFARGIKLESNLHFDSAVSMISASVKIHDLWFYTATMPEKRLSLNSTIRYDPRADTLLLDSFNVLSGRNDLHCTVRLENITGAIQGSEPFIGKVNLNADFFDLTDWLDTVSKHAGAEKIAIANKSAANGSHSVAPAQSQQWQIAVNASFDTLKLNKLLMEHASAEMELGEDSLELLSFNCSMLGGTANATAKVEKHDIEVQLSVHRCQAQQAFANVPMANKISPAVRYISGDFSSTIKGKGKLNSGFNLDYNTFEGTGKIEITHAKISQIPVLSNIAKLAKVPSLENLEANNTTSLIHCKAGTVTVEPTDVKFTNGIGLNIKGTNTFASQINYDIRLDMPTQQMGNIASLAQNFLAGIPGLNVQLPKAMSFYFNVNGPFEKPQTKLIRVSTGG